MGDRVRLAVFGVGRWGVNLLRNFLHLPDAEVVAVVDPRADHLATIRDRFNLDAAIHLSTDGAAVMALPTVDAVVIATPATSHYPLIVAALTQGKHVLAEKPLTLEAESCEALYALAQTHQRQLVIDHTYLFHPVVEQGQTVVAAHRLGALRYGYAARTNLGPVRPDVDALWDLAIHDIAIFNHWLGETPQTVAAQGQVWLQPQAPNPHFPQGLADTVWARLQYPSGVQATIHLSWANPDKQRRLCLVGDRGTLIMDELQPDPLVLQQGQFEPSGDGYFLPTSLDRTVISVPAGEPLQQVCQHFLTCVQTQTPSDRSGGAVATTLVRTLQALSQSLQANGVPVAVTPRTER
ncbi:Gfo/Idh/MocA family protein [Leptolyngbya sp. PCC 6406]|uniref:Gfo/Idh/MocA family protein n=1 Tax=Leptolyngbya sp. PCC 6406 TaxID=1173264 RepID=UPI0002ABF8F9|nr:Gfo/Idh/MocA family oxidoreductase [Leptolyngbya sp. PCC 6406]